jgi:hypothetical protein
MTAAALVTIAAEGELLLADLARLASVEPVPHCPPKCAAMLVKRFPELPWAMTLDKKGEEATP